MAWVRFRPGVISGLSLLLVLALLRGFFSPGSLLFLPLQKLISSNSNSTRIEDPSAKPAKADWAFSLNTVIYLTHFISFLFRRNSWETIFSKSTEVISMVIKLYINCQPCYTFTLPTDSHTFVLVMRILLYIKTISPCR